MHLGAQAPAGHPLPFQWHPLPHRLSKAPCNSAMGKMGPKLPAVYDKILHAVFLGDMMPGRQRGLSMNINGI